MDMKVDEMKYEKRYGLGVDPMAIEDSVSPAYFAKEKELLFKRAWLFVGHVDDIPEIGSYFVKDLEVLDTSIIVTRDKSNKIKAFHNICTHRLNKIMKPGVGKVKAFTCQFHGWAFGLDGKLIHSSNENLFPDFQKEKLGLPMVHADVWKGFIFINVAPEPKQTLAEFLGEMGTQYDNYFEGMELRGKWHIDVNVNWKLFLDANTEAYHAPTLHAKSLAGTISSKDNPNCHFNDVRLIGKHRVASTYANPDYRPPKVEGMAALYAKTPLYPATSATTDKLPPGVNAMRNPLWVFDIAVFFPTFEVSTANGWFLIMMYWPLSESKTRFEVRNYIYPPETAGDIISQEFMLAHQRDVLREDMSTLEGTQQMLASGVLKEMQICDEEITLRHNHLSVAQFMEE
jgi:phenylpropionate dioxygenase-like ring-hydroxylating dioxygenase large terminal subunit